MTDQDKKIADLELEIAFFKNEVKKTNLVNIELQKQLDLHVVRPSFYCNNEYNFIERCKGMCEMCKQLQD
jgi:hypothetical protein